MSEARKKQLNIDGAQVTADDNISSYKPIPEADTELKSKPSLCKSKEKVSDEAEEKLLSEDQPRVTTVNMADAKYVVEDHRNGDAKIELDANKKKFSGLTKEELLKYAEDPFWVRLRWVMFVMFWALWFSMLAGAVAIIIQAPKCAPPPPKQWFEKGPLVDMGDADMSSLEDTIPLLQAAKVEGVFVSPHFRDDYYVLEEESIPAMEKFTQIAALAKQAGIRLIVDLTANFVSTSQTWFAMSENKTGEHADYFTWAAGKDFNDNGTQREPPNNWLSTENRPAWSWSTVRQEYYLHQYSSNQADLNFNNPQVVKLFDSVLLKWMQAGAAGVRLHKARQLVVNSSLPDEPSSSAPGAGLSDYWSLHHKYTSDQPALDDLLQHWSHVVDTLVTENPATGASVFTLYEEGDKPELWLLEHKTSMLRPPSAASVNMDDVENAYRKLDVLHRNWPTIHLKSETGMEELAPFMMLLPAAPLLTVNQLFSPLNDSMLGEWVSRMIPLRADASVEHGNVSLSLVPNVDGPQSLIACLRWKAGHTGYAAVWNGEQDMAQANLTLLPSVPASLTILHVSGLTQELTNYTSNQPIANDELLVPGRSTVVLSYVPKI